MLENLVTTCMKKHIAFILLFFAIISTSSLFAQTPYNAVKTAVAPIIDANPSDACWSKAEWKAIDQVWIGSAVSLTDFEGKFKVVWTPQKLYFLFMITDDKLNINYPGNCTNIYNFDCVEIFIDENHSGGDHQYNYNAFAYHIAANGDVCYNGIDKQFHSFKGDVESKFATISSNVYCWEIALNIYADNYVYGGSNTPVVLTTGKILGMSAAYNDDDNGSTRESMFGSAVINATDKNVSWINASYFGSMQLIEDSTSILTIGISSPSTSITNIAPANILLNATVTNSINPINKVEFFNKSTLIGTVNTSPYTLNWSSVTSGTYSITAKVTDNTGLSKTSSEITIDVKKQQNISLQAGWNLVSFNIAPKNRTIDSVFKSIISKINEIKTFDGFWRDGQNKTYNSLTNIQDGLAYLVNMKTSGTLSLIGDPIALPLIINLKKGWNMVGVVDQLATDISVKAAGKPFESVKNFNGFWLPTGTSNSISKFEPEKGYFINVNNNTTLEY